MCRWQEKETLDKKQKLALREGQIFSNGGGKPDYLAKVQNNTTASSGFKNIGRGAMDRVPSSNMRAAIN